MQEQREPWIPPVLNDEDIDRIVQGLRLLSINGCLNNPNDGARVFEPAGNFRLHPALIPNFAINPANMYHGIYQLPPAIMSSGMDRFREIMRNSRFVKDFDDEDDIPPLENGEDHEDENEDDIRPLEYGYGEDDDDDMPPLEDEEADEDEMPPLEDGEGEGDDGDDYRWQSLEDEYLHGDDMLPTVAYVQALRPLLLNRKPFVAPLPDTRPIRISGHNSME